MDSSEKSERERRDAITGRLVHKGKGAVGRALVELYGSAALAEEGKNPIDSVLTAENGEFRLSKHLDPDKTYTLIAKAFGQFVQEDNVKVGCFVDLVLPVLFEIKLQRCSETGEERKACECPTVGSNIRVSLDAGVDTTTQKKKSTWDTSQQIARFELGPVWGATLQRITNLEYNARLSRPGHVSFPGLAIAKNENGGAFAEAVVSTEIVATEPDVNLVSGKVGVALERTAVHHTRDQALWVAIRNRTRAISFSPYREFMDRVLRAEDAELREVAKFEPRLRDLGANLHGVGSYQLLKLATEAFLLLECGVSIEQGRYENHRLFNGSEESARLDEFVRLQDVVEKLEEYLGRPAQLPYIRRVIVDAFPWLEREGLCCDRVVSSRVNQPCLIELIWSYWHEEGMLVQSMNAINRRFQNVRGVGDRDALGNFEIDPLRRVGNLLWGQIQNELNLLSVKRRAYEYSHQYGLTLFGKATGGIRPADNRSKFLEAFHNLLYLTSVFYKEDNDTTVIADGFPLLNALKEVHLLLAQGAHNQFGDLPWTARAEMMVQEYILARPEIRDFLQSRVMVPYKEAWMPQVDTMKSLQGWSDVTVTHFRDLGVYGEQILLSIRYGDWIDIVDEDSAKNWARYWRPEIQGYLHAYRAVTGVDLTNQDSVDATVPAFHLQKRLAVQHQRMR